MERFELLASAIVSDIIPIKKYRSKETGFTVCIANVDGPLVNGYFCLATEAHDDDGLPHTLEHLVFMGSEEYPYKGMLDLFANRCLAQGTNAWTDTDHTCYTMTTAGSEGFLNLLPIYLDHVLYPTLTNTAFTTEVHHINGNGEDAGVVYCEMQARENSGHSRAFLEFQRAMYPGHCGYKSETGGIMKNLRESCSNLKVRDYHSEFYRPENLCLVITGKVEPADVFRAIQPFEEKIKAKGDRPPYVRPWMSDVPPLEKNEVENHILFATEDESTGMVLIGWRGPPVSELYTISALNMLLEYLTDTPVAPLQQELVETDDPLCGDIGCQFFENKQTAFLFHADNVPKENLLEIKPKILDILGNIAGGKTPFDLERMRTLLHRDILKEMNDLEDRPHDTIATLGIGDFLFSLQNGDLQVYVNKISRLEKLKTEPASFWINLFHEYIIDKRMVVVIADPSEEHMMRVGDEEKKRVARQASELGEDGLRSKKEELENAITKNSVEPSTDVVNKLTIPSTDSIMFHDIKSDSSISKGVVSPEFEKFPLQDMPCAFYVYNVNSLFVQVYVLIDTSSLPDNLRMYLQLYTEILFESPILREGKVIPYEDVINELAADTIENNSFVGAGHGGRFSPGSFPSLISISFKTEVDKYERCVEWVRDVLFNLKFSPERLKAVANKILSDVPDYKRRGIRVASTLIKGINFTEGSNNHVCNVIRQHAFLTNLVKTLETSADQVINDLETLRKNLLVPENFRFYVAANINTLPKQPEKIWKEKLFQNMANALDRVKVVERDADFASNQNKAKAVAIGSVESAYLIQTVDGIDNYNHPDYPAILVFIEYLCALEGPLWRKIRGCGYSYNYSMSVAPNTGKITFVLSKATHIFKAYEVAKQITEDFVTGTTSFERGKIEAAISGTIFKTIEKEETISDAVLQGILSEFKRITPQFHRALLKKVSQVTCEDLKKVAETYFAKLFDPAIVSTALCCHPTKVKEIVQDFKRIGIDFEVIKSLEDEFST